MIFIKISLFNVYIRKLSHNKKSFKFANKKYYHAIIKKKINAYFQLILYTQAHFS